MRMARFGVEKVLGGAITSRALLDIEVEQGHGLVRVPLVKQAGETSPGLGRPPPVHLS